MNEHHLSTRKFGMRDKLTYACGDIANDFTFIMISSFMLKFYTDIMGVSAALVGGLMAAARILDAFTDIGMGTLVDATDPDKSKKFGKFRIWMLRGCIPCVVFGFLIFFGGVVSGSGLPVKIAWMFVTYLLWGSIFYTSVNVPYGSMASAVTGDPDQRTQLSSFRSIGATIASLVLGVVGPLVVYATNADGNTAMVKGKMIAFAGLCACLALVFYLICIFGSVDRVYIPPKKRDKNAPKDPNQKNIAVMLITDKALLILIIGTIFLLLTQLTMQSMANYVFPNYYGNVQAQSMTSLIGCIFMIIIAFFAPKLVQKFGKREVAFVSLFAGAAFFLITYIAHPASAWTFMVFQILAYACLGAFNAICFAMIIDVIDNAELRNGRRDDGKYYGVYSFARKLGQALSSLVSGALLTAIGYTEATAFDPTVTGKIFMLATLIPAIGFAISGVFLFIYPMKKKIVDANAAKLAEIHATEKQNDQQ